MKKQKIKNNSGFTRTLTLASFLCSVLGVVSIGKLSKNNKVIKKIFYKNRTMPKLVSGFTIIETMVAIFILTFALTGLLSLNASSLFSARYARNEITANYLLQEAADYFRNDRDTTAFLNNDPALNDGWNIFLNKYGYNSGVSSGTCFYAIGSNYGCYIELSDTTPIAYLCNTSPAFGTLRCPRFNYDSLASNNTFYTYKVPTGYTSTIFKRQILMQVNPARPDELDIQVKVEWLNGNLVRSRVLQTSLLNWQKQ